MHVPQRGRPEEIRASDGQDEADEQRVDSEGTICGATFKVDVSNKVKAMPRVGSAANWASTWRPDGSYRVPTIRGKELDLHCLFVEVVIPWHPQVIAASTIQDLNLYHVGTADEEHLCAFLDQPRILEDTITNVANIDGKSG
ncbi:hypothetical protein ZIOFF_038000 [Zingiber officinale]|uniref:Uncharacterized protein n=1 Tax=Zingiber officinale TaxID=94328 RepID=A0A8J5GC99_ZINOF|nr:hypothetical protein ZIOFF_038000 [Zingiber officinale]